MHQLDIRTFVRPSSLCPKLISPGVNRKRMSAVEEQWMTYEDKYEVSNLGNVRDKVTQEYRYISYNPVNEYATVSLKVGNEQRNHYVHRMVATAFNLPRREDQTCVDHINRQRADNRVENLRWVTYRENLENCAPRRTNTGEAHITRREQTKKGKKGEYVYIYYTFNYKEHNKTFKTLEAAIEARNAYLAALPNRNAQS